MSQCFYYSTLNSAGLYPKALSFLHRKIFQIFFLGLGGRLKRRLEEFEHQAFANSPCFSVFCALGPWSWGCLVQFFEIISQLSVGVIGDDDRKTSGANCALHWLLIHHWYHACTFCRSYAFNSWAFLEFWRMTSLFLLGFPLWEHRI